MKNWKSKSSTILSAVSSALQKNGTDCRCLSTLSSYRNISSLVSSTQQRDWNHLVLNPFLQSKTILNSPRSSLSHSFSTILLPNLLESHLRLTSPPNLNYIQTRSKYFDEMLFLHKRGQIKKKRPLRQPLGGQPHMKGVVLKTLIKKPKKPNSANRKCVLVRLTNGMEKVAYVPGIGHNLQEHNIVLVRCGRLQDVPGVKLKCVRGVYDLPHVIKPQPNK